MTTTVAIIGAGPLGRWLALSAARAGYSVRLEDVMPANLHHAQEALRKQLRPHSHDETLETEGGGGFNPRIEPAKLSWALAPEGHVAFVPTIDQAVRNADLVIDCVPDELESKLEILWLLDRMAPPRTVLATPTTRLSIADLANCTYRPEKCIAIVAEASALTGRVGTGGQEILLRTTSRTAKESVALVEGFWRRLGFMPVFECDAGEPPR